MLSWELIAHGRVQGVGFRSFARACARQCGITGYARNLWDGSVQSRAKGDPSGVAAFCELLRLGSQFIRVDRLDVS